MANTNTSRPRRNKKKGRRKRNRNGKGSAEEPRVIQKEEDKNNDQIQIKSGSVGHEREQKTEPGPSAAAGDKIKRTDTFRYDKLFKFGKRKKYDESDGSNMKENEQEGEMFCAAKESGDVITTHEDPTLQYDKLFSFSTDGKPGGESTAENMGKEKEHISIEKELPTDTDATSRRATKNSSFRYDRLFSFSNKERTNQTGNEVGQNYDQECIKIKTKQKKGNISSPKGKESACYHSKAGEPFRYDRLFKFNKKEETVRGDGPDEKDKLNASTKVGKSEQKEPVHLPEDKKFTTKTGTTSKAEGNCFFRYDKLFNFSERKQNVPENTDTVSVTSSSNDDSCGYDSETENEAADDDFIGFSRFYRGTLFIVVFLTKFQYHCIRFEVFTALTMRNGVFWDIKTQFVSHRRHIHGGEYEEWRLLGCYIVWLL
jgi:hypothetical protein